MSSSYDMQAMDPPAHSYRWYFTTQNKTRMHNNVWDRSFQHTEHKKPENTEDHIINRWSLPFLKPENGLYDIVLGLSVHDLKIENVECIVFTMTTDCDEKTEVIAHPQLEQLCKDEFNPKQRRDRPVLLWKLHERFIATDATTCNECTMTMEVKTWAQCDSKAYRKIMLKFIELRSNSRAFYHNTPHKDRWVLYREHRPYIRSIDVNPTWTPVRPNDLKIIKTRSVSSDGSFVALLSKSGEDRFLQLWHLQYPQSPNDSSSQSIPAVYPGQNQARLLCELPLEKTTPLDMELTVSRDGLFVALLDKPRTLWSSRSDSRSFTAVYERKACSHGPDGGTNTSEWSLVKADMPLNKTGDYFGRGQFHFFFANDDIQEEKLVTCDGYYIKVYSVRNQWTSCEIDLGPSGGILDNKSLLYERLWSRLRGQYMILTDSDGEKVTTWNIKKRVRIRSFKGLDLSEEGTLGDLAGLSRDGTMIAIPYPGKIDLYRTTTWTPIKTFTLDNQHILPSITQFLNNDNHIATTLFPEDEDDDRQYPALVFDTLTATVVGEYITSRTDTFLATRTNELASSMMLVSGATRMDIIPLHDRLIRRWKDDSLPTLPASDASSSQSQPFDSATPDDKDTSTTTPEPTNEQGNHPSTTPTAPESSSTQEIDPITQQDDVVPFPDSTIAGTNDNKCDKQCFNSAKSRRTQNHDDWTSGKCPWRIKAWKIAGGFVKVTVWRSEKESSQSFSVPVQEGYTLQSATFLEKRLELAIILEKKLNIQDTATPDTVHQSAVNQDIANQDTIIMIWSVPDFANKEMEDEEFALKLIHGSNHGTTWTVCRHKRLIKYPPGRTPNNRGEPYTGDLEYEGVNARYLLGIAPLMAIFDRADVNVKKMLFQDVRTCIQHKTDQDDFVKVTCDGWNQGNHQHSLAFLRELLLSDDPNHPINWKPTTDMLGECNLFRDIIKKSFPKEGLETKAMELAEVLAKYCIEVAKDPKKHSARETFPPLVEQSLQYLLEDPDLPLSDFTTDVLRQLAYLPVPPEHDDHRTILKSHFIAHPPWRVRATKGQEKLAQDKNQVLGHEPPISDSTAHWRRLLEVIKAGANRIKNLVPYASSSGPSSSAAFQSPSSPPYSPNQHGNNLQGYSPGGTYTRKLYQSSFEMLWSQPAVSGDPSSSSSRFSWRSVPSALVFHMFSLNGGVRVVKCHRFNPETLDHPALIALVEFKWNTIGFYYWLFRFICQCFYYVLVMAAIFIQIYDREEEVKLGAVFIAIIASSCVFFFLEVRQMFNDKTYWRSIYNVADLAVFLLPLAGSVNQLFILWGGMSLGWNPGLLSFSVLFIFLHFLFELRVIRKVCRFVSIIIRTIKSVLIFLFIFAGGILAFSIAIIHLLHNCVDPSCPYYSEGFSFDLVRAISMTYFVMGGRYDGVSNALDSDYVAFHLMMAAFFFFTVILMLNVLIGLINHAFIDGDKNWQLDWLQNRMRYVESAENLSYVCQDFRKHGRFKRYFPDVIYYTATPQQVNEYHAETNRLKQQKAVVSVSETVTAFATNRDKHSSKTLNEELLEMESRLKKAFEDQLKSEINKIETLLADDMTTRHSSLISQLDRVLKKLKK